MRNSFSFEKKFFKLKEDFVWRTQRFRLIMRPKLDEFATFKEMPFSLKKNAIRASVLWILTSAIFSRKQTIFQFVAV